MLAKAYSCPPELVPPFYATTLTTITSNDSLEPILEPLYRLRLIDTVTSTNLALASSPLGHSLTRSCPITTPANQYPIIPPIHLPRERNDSHAAIKIHPINPNRRIIFDPQINMFTNPKPKIPRLREILLPQLVFLDFQAALEDFFRFGTADGDVDGDFFVAPDAKCADCVAGFACGEG